MRHVVLSIAVLLLSCRGKDSVDVHPQPVQPTSAPVTAHHEKSPLDPISGRLTEVDGQRVLQLWGTPHQMGFAHGALLRDAIIEVVEGYALRVIPAAELDGLGPIYERVADIPDALREEAAAIVEGMRSAGGAQIAGLERELTGTDLLVLNAMTDLRAIGCSSLSAWGPATADDETLQGQAAIVRNLDWSTEEALLANQVVITYAPRDPERQRVVSVAFAGYLGCLSCINEAGVVASFNMGYGSGAASRTRALTGFAPANLMLRDALERGDVDQDGAVTAADVEAAVRSKTHAGSYIVHLVEPTTVAEADERAAARVLEVEADGVVTRWPGDRLGDHLLAATNHLREKTRPKTCSRYDQIVTTVEEGSGSMDREALWTLGARLRLSDVVHTMVLEPSPRRLTLWLRRPGESAGSQRAPVVHEWTTLFSSSS